MFRSVKVWNDPTLGTTPPSSEPWILRRAALLDLHRELRTFRLLSQELPPTRSSVELYVSNPQITPRRRMSPLRNTGVDPQNNKPTDLLEVSFNVVFFPPVLLSRTSVSDADQFCIVCWVPRSQVLESLQSLQALSRVLCRLGPKVTLQLQVCQSPSSLTTRRRCKTQGVPDCSTLLAVKCCVIALPRWIEFTH